MQRVSGDGCLGGRWWRVMEGWREMCQCIRLPRALAERDEYCEGVGSHPHLSPPFLHGNTYCIILFPGWTECAAVASIDVTMATVSVPRRPPRSSPLPHPPTAGSSRRPLSTHPPPGRCVDNQITDEVETQEEQHFVGPWLHACSFLLPFSPQDRKDTDDKEYTTDDKRQRTDDRRQRMWFFYSKPGHINPSSCIIWR